jgi:hypothetical protein
VKRVRAAALPGGFGGALPAFVFSALRLFGRF